MNSTFGLLRKMLILFTNSHQKKKIISSCYYTIFKHEILKKFPCHFEKFQKDETHFQWLSKEINLSKRKKCTFKIQAHLFINVLFGLNHFWSRFGIVIGCLKVSCRWELHVFLVIIKDCFTCKIEMNLFNLYVLSTNNILYLMIWNYQWA